MSAPVIQKVASPALPQATEQYNRPYQDQHDNVLRLFFNRLTASFNALISPPSAGVSPGGSGLYFPYGEFLTTTTLIAAAPDTPELVALDTTNTAVGMYRLIGDGIHVEQSGVYNLVFSAQYTNQDTKIHDVTVWLRKNGVDLDWTASVTSVPNEHAGIYGRIITAAAFYVELAAGDYVELWWATSNVSTYIESLPATLLPYPRPGSPGMAVSLTFVSAV